MESLIGKKFRSKFNGKVFLVVDLKTEGKHQFYIVRELASGQQVHVHKSTFEEMCLIYLEEEKEQ